MTSNGNSFFPTRYTGTADQDPTRLIFNNTYAIF